MPRQAHLTNERTHATLLTQGWNMSKRVRSRVGVIVAALVGAITAGHVFARPAKAGANCSPQAWNVQLLSVVASRNNVPSTTQQAYWPGDAILASSPGHVRMWTAQSVRGEIGTVEADL